MSGSDDPTRDDDADDATELGAAATLQSSDSNPAAPPSGARYGRFVVEGALGTGGMGVVLAARDPELDRRVALKLLRPDVFGDDLAQARLLREAQAMAKLSHPNVVTVYEVGRAGAQLFVAMELVDGATLRAWLDEHARPWREVVAIFVAAGRGLAAAHAAGLVHRDFKPQNVLLGRDGRPRVTDFGLVSSGARVDDTARDAIVGPGLDSSLTFRGSAVGTPAYMSAEQWAGEVVDARSDQFSFCVALWEGVYGVRPFKGKAGPALAALVNDGEIAAPPSGRPVPRWLEAALRRGLARNPEQRWGSLSALLDELDRRTRGGRRALRIAGAVGAAVTFGLVVATVAAVSSDAPAAPPPPCPAPDARLEAVWGPARRDAVREALVAVDPALGANRFDTAAASFDRGAIDWRDQHVAACTATRVEGRQSDSLLDLRMRCLDRWLRELDGTIGLLEAATGREELDRAVVAVTRLLPLSDCADTAALGARPPPDSAADRTEALAIEDELDAIRLAKNAGALDGLLDRARAVVDRARALHHPPTLADALYGLGTVAAVLGDGSERELVEELTRAAAVAGDDGLAAYAWVQLVEVHGSDLDQPDRAAATLASAETALLRAGDPPSLRFDLLTTRASLLGEAGKPAEAVLLLDQAEQLIDDVDPERLIAPVEDYRGRLMFLRANVLESAEDYEGAVVAYRATIAQRIRQLGADHPDVARVQVNLGETLRKLDRMDEAGVAYEEAARIVEARVGESAMLAMALDRRATIYYEQERSELALPLFERAAAIGERTLGPEHPRYADLLGDLASAQRDLGRLDEAVATFDRSLAINERGGHVTTNVAIGYFNRGNVHSALERWDQAAADHLRAVEIMEKLGVDEYYLISFLFAVGRDRVNGGKPAEAIAPLERALAIPTPGIGEEYLALSRYMLGRARVDAGRDRKGGLAQARKARDEIEQIGAAPETLAEMDAWLKKQR